MAERPEKFPAWAREDQTDPVSGQVNRSEPPEARKDSGWNRQEIPPRQWLNWLTFKANEWIEWLTGRVDVLRTDVDAAQTTADTAQESADTAQTTADDHIANEETAHGASVAAEVGAIMRRKNDGRGGDIEDATGELDPVNYRAFSGGLNNHLISRFSVSHALAVTVDTIDQDETKVASKFAVRVPSNHDLILRRAFGFNPSTALRWGVQTSTQSGLWSAGATTSFDQTPDVLIASRSDLSEFVQTVDVTLTYTGTAASTSPSPDRAVTLILEVVPSP